MKGQYPGMSDPRQRQQSGFNDMQLWQQHIMYKQLQELQRQQQLQQLDQEARKQNLSNQFSSSAKQPAANQLPLVVNGMPIHDASDCTWTNECVGGESKIPSSCQVFTVGNMNWTQQRRTMPMQGFSKGLSFSQNEGQALRSMGLVPRQPDHSLYGTPFSSNSNILNQYSQFPGVSNNSADMTAKTISNKVEKQPMRSAVFNSFQSDQCLFPAQVFMQDVLAVKQNFQGKTVFGQVPSQNINSGIMPVNVQQLSSLGRTMQAQEFQNKNEQTDWSGNLQEKTVPHVGTRQGTSNLDPTEQKLLFGTDDESPWHESSGSCNISPGSYLHGNLLESNDYFNAFPSVQSGSWSALMQSAVAEASSSDTGLQDEWSGANFQKKEPSIGNHLTAVFDRGKQQTTLTENLQSASTLTSRPFPLSEDADTSTKDCSAAIFHPTLVKPVYDHGQRVVAEPSSSCQLDQNQVHQKILEGAVQAQMHFGNTLNGAWVGESYDQQLSTVHAETKLNQHSLHDSMAHQQNMPLYEIGSQTYSNMNAWNINELLPSGGDAILKANDPKTAVLQQHLWVNCPKGATHVQRDQEGNMWKAEGSQKSVSFPHPTRGFSIGESMVGSSQGRTGHSYMGGFVGMNLNNSRVNEEADQQSFTKQRGDYVKLVSADSSVESKGNENAEKHQCQVNKDPVICKSSVNIFEKAPVVAYNGEREHSSQKELSDGNYISSSLHPTQANDAGAIEGEDSLLSGSVSSHSVSGNKRPSHQIGQKNSGARTFQFHPMGNLEIDVALDTPKQNSYSQEQFQTIPSQMRSLEEPNFIRQSQVAGHMASNNKLDMNKLFDSQRDAQRTEDIDCGGKVSVYESGISSSFEGSAAILAQNMCGQRSQNMLELLHKVDQSRDSSNVSPSGFSNHNMVPKRHDKGASDMPSYLVHNQASDSQGISLALPQNNQSIVNHALSSQDFIYYNSRNLDPEAAVENNQACASSVPVCTLPPLHEISQRENRDKESNVPVRSIKETSQSNMQVNSVAICASRLPYVRNQLQQQQHQHQQLQQQQQQISIASGCVGTNIDQSVNLPYGNQPDQDSHSKNTLHIREFNDLHSRAIRSEDVTDKSGQQSLPAVSQILPFKLTSSYGRSPVASHPHASDIGQLHAFGTISSLRSSNQITRPETPSVSQPSVTPVMAKQGAFSAMLQNMWTNVPVQQHLSGNLPTNRTPNLSQSVNSITVETDSWALQRTGDQGKKKGQSSSEFGTCSINSQQLTRGEEQAVGDGSLQQILPQKVNIAPGMSSAPQGHESLSQHALDGNSSVSIPSMVQLYQQDIDKLKRGHSTSLDKQIGHTSLLNIASSSHASSTLDHSFKSSHIQHHNYSLLQQLQAMKSVEAEPSKHHGKRLKGDYGADAQQMPQNFVYGYNTVAKVLLDDELFATDHKSSFPSDTKMLCFSSEASEDQHIVRASHIIGSDIHSQDMTGAGFNDFQNYSCSLDISMPSSVGVTQLKRIDPQMAPSWFEQYGKFRNGQTLAMHSGLGGPTKTAKAAVQHYVSSKASESIIPISTEQRNDSSQVRYIWQNSSTATANGQSSSLNYASADVIDHSLNPRPKRRRTASSDLLPWHKEITKLSDNLRNTSMAELDWSKATNRLIEKVEDKAQMNEDRLSMPRARRRLILTTQLMKQLLPAVPTRFLTADATSGYESVIYLVAKLALGDACGRICSRSDCCVPSDSINMISEKLQTTESIGEQFVSEVVEDCIGRVRKLENNLSRLEKRASILDMRVECQDLERISIINRFAKFHGRGQAEGVESSSNSETDPWRMFPQRYVTALSLPGNPPEGMICLSL